MGLRQGHFFEQMRLWFGKCEITAGRGRENTVTLAPAFRKELRDHPIPVDTGLFPRAEVSRTRPGMAEARKALLDRMTGCCNKERSLPPAWISGVSEHSDVAEMNASEHNGSLCTWLQHVARARRTCSTFVSSSNMAVGETSRCAVLVRNVSERSSKRSTKAHATHKCLNLTEWKGR